MQPQAPEKAKKPKRSKGEKHFDWMTYVGWNHITNLALSAVATYWSRGKVKTKNKLINRWKTSEDDTYRDILVRWVSKDKSKHAQAEVLVDTTMLSVGGNITALGVKPLEDHKEELVRKFNEKHAPDEVDRPLVDQRKQTWFSIIAGRVAVIGGVILAMTGFDKMLGESKVPDPRNPKNNLRKLAAFENSFAEKIFTKPFGLKTDFKNPSRVLKMGKVVSLELIAVTLGSAIFYVASKMLSQKPKPDMLDASDSPQKAAALDVATAATKSPLVTADTPLQTNPDAPGAKIQLSKHAHVAPVPAQSSALSQS
jgi:hypothetical protein